MIRKKYTEEDYKHRCEELNLNFIGTHKEKKKGTIIEFTCDKHLDKGIQNCDWSHFKDLSYGCKYCSGRGLTTKDIQDRLANTSIKLISEYKGCEKPITCECMVCGNIWETIPKVLTTNGSGCPKCGRIKAGKHRTKSQDDFVKDLFKAAPSIKVIGEYKGTHKKIKVECLIDGTKWDAYPSNLLNNSAGCPTCNMSNGERKMCDILTAHGFKYIRQYKFDDCKYKYRLKFDAYDYENNIAYEYNGRQHYEPVSIFGGNSNDGKSGFELTTTRDNIKREFCKKNNIPLVEIPYWVTDMESFILEQFNKIMKEREKTNGVA